MAFLDKLKFWKSGDEPLKPLGGEGGGFGGETAGASQGAGGTGTDSAGGGGDSAPGLGGTGSLGEMPGAGSGEGQPQQSYPQQQPQNPAGAPADSDLSLRGPSYEKPPESGDLRHAPLSPAERQQPQQGSSGQVSHDAEVLSAKLDAIKANIESINHRLESIERVVMNQERRRVQW